MEEEQKEVTDDIIGATALIVIFFTCMAVLAVFG